MKCLVAHITIKDYVVISDPDNPATACGCEVGKENGKSDVKHVLANCYMYETQVETKKSQRRPRVAFDEAVRGWMNGLVTNLMPPLLMASRLC